MKTRYFLLILAALFSFFACDDKVLVPEETRTEYSDLVISEFSYPVIPAEGGQVSPVIKYSYKESTLVGDKVMSSATREDGAKMTFNVELMVFSVDEKGVVTASQNPDVQLRTSGVTVEVTVGNLSARKASSVSQTASENVVVSVETFQVPVAMKPHTAVKAWYDENNRLIEYESTSKDGTCDFTLSDRYIEFVSCCGCAIGIEGGQLVRRTTYLSGEVEDEVLEEPVFSTSRKFGDSEGEDPAKWTDEKKKDRGYKSEYIPSSSYKDGVWTIGSFGPLFSAPPLHILTAKVSGYESSVSVYQIENRRMEEIPLYNVYTGKCHVYAERDLWPNFEDYPVGCPSPKWGKDEYGCYFDFGDTKDLHPDGNRTIGLLIGLEKNNVRPYSYPRYRYYNGTETEEIVEGEPFMRYWTLDAGMVITAEADVPLADGTTRHVKHVSEFLGLSCGRAWGCLSYYTCIEIPVEKDAVKDFQWTVKFDWPYTEDVFSWTDIPGSNFKDLKFDWPTLTYWDRKSTVADYKEAKHLSGIFSVPCDYDSEWYGDIIDGQRNPNPNHWEATRNVQW